MLFWSHFVGYPISVSVNVWKSINGTLVFCDCSCRNWRVNNRFVRPLFFKWLLVQQICTTQSEDWIFYVSLATHVWPNMLSRICQSKRHNFKCGYVHCMTMPPPPCFRCWSWGGAGPQGHRGPAVPARGHADQHSRGGRPPQDHRLRLPAQPHQH